MSSPFRTTSVKPLACGNTAVGRQLSMSTQQMPVTSTVDPGSSISRALGHEQQYLVRRTDGKNPSDEFPVAKGGELVRHDAVCRRQHRHIERISPWVFQNSEAAMFRNPELTVKILAGAFAFVESSRVQSDYGDAASHVVVCGDGREFVRSGRQIYAAVCVRLSAV